jgi:hypothetical protein
MIPGFGDSLTVGTSSEASSPEFSGK